VVEGANDVIRLDALGVAAVGLCSNKATGEQIEKIVRFARQAADGRVLLLPNTDEAGEAGCRELAWRLLEEGIHVRLGWSRSMFGGAYRDRQPEQLAPDEWERIASQVPTTHSAAVTPEPARYSVFTWDHEYEDWQARERQATKWQLRQWLRTLYAESWDRVSILVQRNA
jgi:5S rRNA maturation endonuclease (ribonuclease M5)